ncbi:hypothetical protein Har1130_18425 [Haloarcula sp. CBA1130]|uniref:hypothetical protein n=1 Tax=unclassified Haloarcula TaxID=2624677 RepID=UPI00124903F1|nr:MULTISPECIES: hypothetical protein [unclassified Haloarcula]KAA9396616.1 hypothetical protein Har1130_18425 [Haloarcula sp. CBA1130]KAA9397760.1 hypothetical protein Har1129_05835 [Haloarcula sp. CBA1129]
MSSEESPEDIAETSAKQAGGLGEVIPDPLLPIWRRIELIQEFRETHGDSYVKVLETLTAIALTGGYIWWMYLYLMGGSGVPI